LRSLDSTACSCCCPLIIPSYAKTAPKLPAQAFPEPITAADQSLAAGSAEPLEQAHLRPAIGGETDRNLRKAPALHYRLEVRETVEAGLAVILPHAAVTHAAERQI